MLNVTNLKLSDVGKAFDAIPKTGKDFRFTGGIKEDGGDFTHLQGLSAHRDVHLLTQSDETHRSGRLLVADRRAGSQTLLRELDLPVVSETMPFYFHAGGCQLIGDCLVVPSETRKNKSVVAFFDVSDPASAREVDVALRITRDIRDAAAAGVTNFTRGGQEVWLVAVFDSGTVDFYESRDLARPLPFTLSFSCKIIEKHHQSLVLLTDTTNRVFAIGINKTFIGENTAVLYEVDFVNHELTLIKERKFSPKGGASLRWGADLEIASDARLVMHCSSKHYTKGCHINAFDSTAPAAVRAVKASAARKRKKKSVRPPRRRKGARPRRSRTT
jgi:hypothetical protein